MSIWTVAVLVFLLNLPFGYWRAKQKKFSVRWFLAIHLPITGVIALRVYSDIGWQLITFPVLPGAFSLGQFLGGRLSRRVWRAPGLAARARACHVRQTLDTTTGDPHGL